VFWSVVEFLAAGDECGGLVLGYFFFGLCFGCRIIFFVGDTDFAGIDIF